MALIRADGRFLRVNPALCEMLGRPAGDLLSLRWHDVIHPGDRRAGEAAARRVLAGTPLDREFRTLTPTGETVVLRITARALDRGDGAPEAIVAHYFDVSDLRRGDADRARLGALAEAVADAIVVQDPRGVITGWNLGAEQTFGLDADEAIGRRYEDVVVPERERPAFERVRRDLAYGRTRTLRMGALRADGAVFPAQVSAAALAGSGGSVAGTLAIVRDITDLVETQRELERSNSELERFAYTAGHDLQEPLRSIMLGAEAVLRAAGGRLSEDERRLLEHVEESAARMSAQVRALLELARVALAHEPDEPVPLQRPLDDALDALRVAVRESGAEVRVRAPLPSTAVPRTEMALVLQNLIANAVKFRQPGEPPRITIGAAVRDGAVELTVADAGVGLSAEVAARIFDLFERAGASVAGTGVGLSVCRQIVDRRGGSIRASSPGPGQGAEFTLRLPPA